MKKLVILLFVLIAAVAYIQSKPAKKLEKHEINKQKQPLALRLVCCSDALVIESPRKKIISDARKIFEAGISPKFKDWEFNDPGPSTGKKKISIYETEGKGTFLQIFTSLSNDLESAWLTQAQISDICELHPNWLNRDGLDNLILTKIKGAYFVITVTTTPKGLAVDIDCLANSKVVEKCQRIIIVRQEQE